jgi:hypothetical protein
MPLRQPLQSMENRLSEEGKVGSAIAHAFNQLQFVDFPLDQSV